MNSKEAPYFIKIRGCINCTASAEHKKKTGFDYGFDHELIAKCLLIGCFDHGYSLDQPYFDPEEIVQLANKNGTSEFKYKAKAWCLNLQNRFGNYYQSENISIPKILEKLEI